ncbi:MAG: hypothetical protein JOY95_01985 [Silvibacterium sp.]|nr:hypothetical protein [Silvibacterium sp.]
MTRTLRSVTLACLLAGTLLAADDPFVGKWKLNTVESKITGEQDKIVDLGANKYKFIFGNMSETIVMDGTDQPLQFGAGTWALKPEGSDTWKEVDKRDGKVTAEAAWKMSDDGKLLTIDVNGTRVDGSTFSNQIALKRVGGSGTGLAGTWQSTKVDLGAPLEFDIEPYESDGLSFMFPAEKDNLSMKFDGKEYSEQGPNVAAGSMSSGRRTSPNRLEVTSKIKGKEASKTEYVVSPDGKKLTLTIHEPGQMTPLTIVYDRM